jgi:hypothetical protein
MTDERIDASAAAMTRILRCPAVLAPPEKPRKRGGLIGQPAGAAASASVIVMAHPVVGRGVGGGCGILVLSCRVCDAIAKAPAILPMRTAHTGASARALDYAQAAR